VNPLQDWLVTYVLSLQESQLHEVTACLALFQRHTRSLVKFSLSTEGISL